MPDPCWTAWGEPITECGITDRLYVRKIEGVAEYIASSELFHDFRMENTDCAALWRDAEGAIRGRLMARAVIEGDASSSG